MLCLELRNRLGGQVLPAATQLSTYYPLLHRRTSGKEGLVPPLERPVLYRAGMPR